MEVRWVDKNIPLSTVVKVICRFFEKKNFNVSVSETESKFTIIATPKSYEEISEEIKIFVEGKTNDFTVEFFSGTRAKNMFFWGSLTSFLGGGFIGLKGVKSKEVVEKLERSFWKFLTCEISNLA
jgi:hypothetical protein